MTSVSPAAGSAYTQPSVARNTRASASRKVPVVAAKAASTAASSPAQMAVEAASESHPPPSQPAAAARHDVGVGLEVTAVLYRAGRPGKPGAWRAWPPQGDQPRARLDT